MDWKLFASTFGLVFLAELGDKTQLATMSMAAASPRRLVVFLAAAAALLAATVVSVLAGSILGHVVEGPWIKRTAGALFIVMGILFMLGKD